MPICSVCIPYVAFMQMEIDEPFLPNIQVTLTFSDENQYFASRITRSIIVTDEHRTAHLDVEWKLTQVSLVPSLNFPLFIELCDIGWVPAGGCCATR